jgi:hypothetical protein
VDTRISSTAGFIPDGSFTLGTGRADRITQ